ncbi:MAG: DinB family protein [Acidimicrobiia bacterium]|nr:DinB family protein [Acidimicrobiia bacterium]
MNETPSLRALLAEYDRALMHTDELWLDLDEAEVGWRPVPESSAIGWHLGHQAAVAHYMLRNLTAAQQSPDPDLDRLMDSATPERERGDLPGLDRLRRYRYAVADAVRVGIGEIDEGRVGAPAQLRHVARTMLTAIVNHEYQHSTWIGEVRRDQLGHALPTAPSSDRLTEIDGYIILR